jgi:hypothetical protein
MPFQPVQWEGTTMAGFISLIVSVHLEGQETRFFLQEKPNLFGPRKALAASIPLLMERQKPGF